MDTGFEEGTVGLFPLDGETEVLTSGLKWDVNGSLRFGEMCSSQCGSKLYFSVSDLPPQ